jgi:hypothetical protein
MPSESAWIAITAVTSVLTLLVVLVGGGVMWGSLTEKVSSLTKRAETCEAWHQGHDVRLNSHDVALAKLQEWKDGYNAAARVAGRTAELS